MNDQTNPTPVPQVPTPTKVATRGKPVQFGPPPMASAEEAQPVVVTFAKAKRRKKAA